MGGRYNPDEPTSGDQVFGLPTGPTEAAIVLTPVPFDATASGRAGAADAPRAILRASHEIDLMDRTFGRVDRHGIFMEAIDDRIVLISRRARELAEAILRGDRPEAGSIERIDAAGAKVNQFVFERVCRTLEHGQVPGLIGGDHSVGFGAIRACADRMGPIGVLQIDAHMDLHRGYAGLAWSHASVMRNVLDRVPGVERVVQVGLRDVAPGEMDWARDSRGRVHPFFDADWHEARDNGAPLVDLASEAIDLLPERVYVSFDIDALDPSLCPRTGTPVPGGLGFNDAALLLRQVARSGRQVVGFDLVEVGPDPWDANVGARILYKLCGMAAAGRPEPIDP